MLLDHEKFLILGARKQLTITEILKKAHISSLTYQNIKAGKEVRMNVAGKLAAALDVDIEELVAD